MVILVHVNPNQNKQYSPMFNTTFDLMSDANIKLQMDDWVQNGTLPSDIKAVNMNKRIRSVNADETITTDLFLKPNKMGYSYDGVLDTIEYENGKAYFVQRVNNTQDGLLATPIKTELNPIGLLNGYIGGTTCYIDTMLRDADIYTNKATVSETSQPILSIDNIVIIKPSGNVTLDKSLAVIAT
jgi:hypothetical protein